MKRLTKKRLSSPNPARSMSSLLAVSMASFRERYSSRERSVSVDSSRSLAAPDIMPGARSATSATIAAMSSISYDLGFMAVPLKSISSIPTLGGTCSPFTTSSMDW